MTEPSAVADPLEPKTNRATRRANVKIEKKTRTATFAQLRKKPARQDKCVIPSVDDAGNVVDLVVRFRAIGSNAYDELVAGHPPNKKQESHGEQFNPDTFAPALISACASEPLLSVEESTEIYTSDEWSGGEIMALFYCAQRVCNAGLDVPFSAGV